MKWKYKIRSFVKMDYKDIQKNNRFLKLSLKKNRQNLENETKKMDHYADVLSLDDSFDRLRLDLPKTMQPTQINSPIVISDSSLDETLPKISLDMKAPSRSGNISFNCSKEEEIEDKKSNTRSRPSFGGWSPAQHIICATPKHDAIPSSPRDIANESQEKCSIKKIHQSQKKLLNDLYGEVWKSIPKLFKTTSHDKSNFDGCTKKLQFEDEDSDKENIRDDLKRNRELYLTLNFKKPSETLTDTERKSKKKLFTETVPNTPELPKQRVRNINSTTKKTKASKALSVTELVEVMKKDVDPLTSKLKEVAIERISFMGSLADDVPSWRCNVEAMQYRDNYNSLREKLTRRLYVEFNKHVFDNALDEDLPIIWDTKLRTTAGKTMNRLIKTSKGCRVKTSSIRLSHKVLDSAVRLRDTLVHEMCHSATWLLDGDLKAGHGPLWKKWATRALKVFPELQEIKRCHNMQIHFKYSYVCKKCGYSIHRHSKSIDITKKCCGYCKGHFEIVLNKKNKDGIVVSTPAKSGNMNEFAMYVKENYGSLKNGKTHAEVMKVLGEQFSAKKNKPL